MSPLDQLVILAQVVGAAVLAGFIGFEREVANKPAGGRTHMLLASAATLLVAVASAFVGDASTEIQGELLRADPLRVIEAIVAGVAFLGAGTIIRSRDTNQVEGLTTATSLLVVAAIGVAIALELYLLAVLTTVFTLLVLRAMERFEHFAAKRLKERSEEE